VTISTPRHEIQAEAARLAPRLGNDLAELAVVVELANQHGLMLPAGLRRAATALADDAVEYATDAEHRLLYAPLSQGGEAA
jgi:hypothetical protein